MASVREEVGTAEVTRPVRSRWWALLLLSLTLLGTVLRLTALASSGLWRDEALFLFVAQSPTIGDMLHFLRWHESHPPLFYLLMRGWLAAFGPTVASATALPLLLGIALVPAAYLTGTRMFGRRIGFISALLIAWSALLAKHSVFVRPYSFLPLLCLGSTFLLWRGLQTARLLPWLGYASLTAAMLYTHNWAWLILAGQVAVAAVAMLRSEPMRRRLGHWALALVSLLLLYAPWAPALAYQAQHAGHPPYAAGASVSLFLSVASLAFGLWSPVAGLLLLLMIVVVLRRFHMAGAVQDSSTHPHDRLGYGLCFGVPAVTVALAILLSARSNLLVVACLVAILPLLILGLAYTLGALFPGRMLWIGTLAVVSLYVLDWSNTRTWIKSNAREVAHAVADRAAPDDLIVIAPGWLASSFNYYYAGANQQLDYPDYGRQEAVRFDSLLSRMADPEAFREAKRRLRDARVTYRSVWFIAECKRIIVPVTNSDSLPLSVHLSYSTVGYLRANQLLQELTRLYGPADTVPVPEGARDGIEILCPLLFRHIEDLSTPPPSITVPAKASCDFRATPLWLPSLRVSCPKEQRAELLHGARQNRERGIPHG